MVLACDPGWLDDVVRAERPRRLLVVLTRGEVGALLAELQGVPWIMAMLLYGSGMRLMECHRLRVKDVDFERPKITVREGKGSKDRVTMLPLPAARAGHDLYFTTCSESCAKAMKAALEEDVKRGGPLPE